MAMKVDTSDNLDSSNILSAPGTYHMMVTDTKEHIDTKEGERDGFTVCGQVLAGTDPNAVGNTIELTFWPPDYSRDAKSVDATKKVNTAILVALNLIDPTKMGEEKEIELSEANGSQFVVTMERKMDKDPNTGKYTVETKFLRIRFHDVYHVDDPAVETIPKDADALSLIPKEKRHDASWFSWKDNGKVRPAVQATKQASTSAKTSDFASL